MTARVHVLSPAVVEPFELICFRLNFLSFSDSLGAPQEASVVPQSLSQIGRPGDRLRRGPPLFF